jgi:predicted enzyme related to lactoylglutathione lyase
VGTFVWHEQVSSDPAKAEEFYTQLFGWGTEVFKPGEIDYKMISSSGQTHGGFSTAMEGAPPPHWLGHVREEDVDETVEKAPAGRLPRRLPAHWRRRRFRGRLRVGRARDD